MSDTLVVDRIESNLSRLRLSRIRETLQQVINAAEDKGKRWPTKNSVELRSL
jgi:hypothetical protein